MRTDCMILLSTNIIVHNYTLSILTEYYFIIDVLYDIIMHYGIVEVEQMEDEQQQQQSDNVESPNIQQAIVAAKL